MLDLQLFQVREPIVGRGHAAQLLLGVGQHQARAVHVEHGVRGVHDLVQRVLDLHLPEAEPAQLAEGGSHVLEFCVHGSTLARIFPIPAISSHQDPAVSVTGTGGTFAISTTGSGDHTLDATVSWACP